MADEWTAEHGNPLEQWEQMIRAQAEEIMVLSTELAREHALLTEARVQLAAKECHRCRPVRQAYRRIQAMPGQMEVGDVLGSDGYHRMEV